jgi:hypothetical protein
MRGTEGTVDPDSEDDRSQLTGNGISQEELRERILEQTRMFTLEKLKSRHCPAIGNLAVAAPPPLFPDPILGHPDSRSSGH